MQNFSDGSLYPLQLSDLFKILQWVWDPEYRIFYSRAATEVKIPLFITEKLQSCIHWLIQSSHSTITLLSTKVHSYFSTLLPPLRCSMILCSKGKPSRWVLLKRLLFHNIHCLLGNWDPSQAMSHHHNSIWNHGFCSSRRVMKITYPWLEVVRHH